MDKYKCLSGLSDHTTTSLAPLASVALGGSMIEKHFKLDNRSNSVDSFFSLTSNQFSNMVNQIRLLEKAMGDGKIKISKSSKKNLNSKRSIYVSKKIKKGEKLNKENIKIVRPGYSLDPKYYDKLINKTVNKSLNVGDRLKLKYVKKLNDFK